MEVGQQLALSVAKGLARRALAYAILAGLAPAADIATGAAVLGVRVKIDTLPVAGDVAALRALAAENDAILIRLAGLLAHADVATCAAVEVVRGQVHAASAAFVSSRRALACAILAALPLVADVAAGTAIEVGFQEINAFSVTCNFTARRALAARSRANLVANADVATSAAVELVTREIHTTPATLGFSSGTLASTVAALLAVVADIAACAAIRVVGQEINALAVAGDFAACRALAAENCPSVRCANLVAKADVATCTAIE